MNTSTPSDEVLLQATTELRLLHPELGRAKFLALLKEKHSWVLSEARLKKCLDQNNLNVDKIGKGTNNTNLPRDANFQNIVKDAFIDFKVRERNFFLTLPPSQCRKLTPGGGSDPMYAACHLRQHIEFLLVMKGLKPCFIVVHYRNQEVFTEMVEKCLKPVIEIHHLERFGYRLQLIDHPTPTTVHRGFQNGWVFMDTRSPLYPEVTELFITPYAGKADDNRFGVALGYPTREGPHEFRAVDYTEMAEMRVATQKEVCCVTAYEFNCGPNPALFNTLFMHFDRCEKAVAEVGTALRMDPEGHPEFEKWLEGH